MTDSNNDATERETRLEQARTDRIHAELEKQKKESRDAAKNEVKRVVKRLPGKAKIGLLVAFAIALVAVFGFVLPFVTDDHETHYLSESDLKAAVEIDSLSAVDYVYHGVAEKRSQFLWQDRVDYRVRYEAHVRASYKLSAIRFTIDEENKKIIAYLPEAEIGEPQLDHNKFGYLPENAMADIKDVIALCREDAASDVNEKEIKSEAYLSLQDTVRALTMPLVGDEYSLEFKPIAEHSEGVDLVE